MFQFDNNSLRLDNYHGSKSKRRELIKKKINWRSKHKKGESYSSLKKGEGRKQKK